MIQMSLPAILIVYVVFGLAFIGSLLLWAAWLRKRRESEVLRYRLQCIICAFPFEDKTGIPLPQCPKCGSLNERNQT